MALRPPLVLKAGEKQQHQTNDTVEIRSNAALASLPTGGTITTAGGYRIHTFTSDGFFVIPIGLVIEIEVLIVAGGGGGGGGTGGGGGAGGLVLVTPTEVVAGSYAATIGGGGAGGAGIGTVGSNGANSSLSGFTAAVGGGGGGGNSANGNSGGSGGGAGYTGAGGAATFGQGNAGGAGSSGPPNYGGGGGGGAGAVGTLGTTTVGGNGGAGLASSISGSSVTYAGGGGAGTFGGGTGGSGGAGGGGNVATNGTTNTGGGGGGQQNNGGGAAGNGGSGIIVIRYLIPTTPQLRLSYDGTNLHDTTVTISGQVKSNAQGIAPEFDWLLNGFRKMQLSPDGELFVAGTAWTAYTPTVICGTANPTTLGTVTGRYKQYGKIVYIQAVVQIITNGPAAIFVGVSLPVAYKAGFVYILAGRENNIHGAMLQCYTSAAAPGRIDMRKYDNTYPGGDGTVLQFSGIYEAA